MRVKSVSTLLSNCKGGGVWKKCPKLQLLHLVSRSNCKTTLFLVKTHEECRLSEIFGTKGHWIYKVIAKLRRLFSFIQNFFILGNLTMLTLTCSLVMIKDVVFHRMGRIQCWMFYKIRRFFKRQPSSTEEFRTWYFEERFCNFRACVLNNDLLHEFTGRSNSFKQLKP